MNKLALDNALTLVVPTSIPGEMYRTDLEKQMALYEIAETAKNDFLASRLTFSEYIEVCQECGVKIDSYLETIEHNLCQFKLI